MDMGEYIDIYSPIYILISKIYVHIIITFLFSKWVYPWAPLPRDSGSMGRVQSLVHYLQGTCVVLFFIGRSDEKHDQNYAQLIAHWLGLGATESPSGVCCTSGYRREAVLILNDATHWGRNKMATILQTTFSTVLFKRNCLYFDTYFTGLSLRVYFIYWGRVTHICIGKLTIIGPDKNGLSPVQHQAIIWTNVRILLIRTLGTNFSK